MVGVAVSIVALVAWSCSNAPDTTTTVDTLAVGQNSDAPTLPDAANSVVFAPSDCRIVDPAIDAAATDRFAFALPLVSEVHAGLMRFDESGRVPIAVPDIAARFSISDDRLSYRFTLRRHAKFSDGFEVTAADFKWSWERALRTALPQGRAMDVFSHVDGVAEFQVGFAENVAGFEIVDSKTINIRLKAPRTRFEMMLADPVASVLKRDNVRNWGFQFANSFDPHDAVEGVPPGSFAGVGKPVGAGPFRVVSYSPYELHRPCVIESNPFYHGRKPSVQYVVISSLLSQDWASEDNVHDTSTHAYINDAIDYMNLSPDRARVESVGEGDLQGNVQRYDAVPSTMFLYLNPAVAPLDDLNVRRAIVAATDVLHAFSPNSINWERRVLPDSVAPKVADSLEVAHDAVAAQDFLAASSYADESLPTIALFAPRSYPFLDVLERVASSWQGTLGVDVEIIAVHQVEIDQAVAEGAVPIRVIDLSLAYPDPDAVFSRLPGALAPLGSSPEVDQLEDLIRSGINETDSAAREARHIGIEEFMRDHALVVPLVTSWGGSFIITKPWIEGFRVPRYPGSAFRDLTVGPDAPTRALPE